MNQAGIVWPAASLRWPRLHLVAEQHAHHRAVAAGLSADAGRLRHDGARGRGASGGAAAERDADVLPGEEGAAVVQQRDRVDVGRLVHLDADRELGRRPRRRRRTPPTAPPGSSRRGGACAARRPASCRSRSAPRRRSRRSRGRRSSPRGSRPASPGRARASPRRRSSPRRRGRSTPTPAAPRRRSRRRQARRRRRAARRPSPHAPARRAARPRALAFSVPLFVRRPQGDHESVDAGHGRPRHESG